MRSRSMRPSASRDISPRLKAWNGAFILPML
jgi:hypothetical protein